MRQTLPPPNGAPAAVQFHDIRVITEIFFTTIYLHGDKPEFNQPLEMTKMAKMEVT
jgi:hypothetical protein